MYNKILEKFQLYYIIVINGADENNNHMQPPILMLPMRMNNHMKMHLLLKCIYLANAPSYAKMQFHPFR